MGFPEIVDVARNFAVMVRIQGPDPKGLKMRQHAFHHYNSGKTILSASGMLLPGFTYNGSVSHHSMLVLTVASLIEPFLLQQHRDDITKDKPQLISGVQIDILVEGERAEHNVKETAIWLPAELLTMVNIPVASAAVQSILEASSGSVEHGWEVGSSLVSHDVRSQVKQSLSSPSVLSKSATRIALLKISSKHFKGLRKFNKACSSKRGDILLAMGSPFGILSHIHFFNSIAVGSIANSFKRSLLMADIRCLPGMEGGPVFGEQGQFIGILTRPLRQRTSGAEVQLVIPWEAIASTCNDLLNETPQISTNELYNDTSSITNHLEGSNGHFHESLVIKAMSSILLISTNDGSWASGVLLNNKGLILTNAHLLEPWRFTKTSAHGEKDHRGIKVRLNYNEPWIWSDAKIVYVCKGPLDVALLQLESVPDQAVPINADFESPLIGSKVSVVGHGLFGPRCELLPSACSGVIAKVVEAKKATEEGQFSHFPVMLETTAPVHPGGSGGAVINMDGCMIGLVTSNARHGGGVVIPHLNFSIPCAALKPIFRYSQDMQDLSLLDDLDKPNEHISSVWALTPSVSSPKPGPLLPSLPKLPIENDNSLKGSRFSKFIAERHEFVKKPNQQSKFLPSKL